MKTNDREPESLNGGLDSPISFEYFSNLQGESSVSNIQLNEHTLHSRRGFSPATATSYPSRALARETPQ